MMNIMDSLVGTPQPSNSYFYKNCFLKIEKIVLPPQKSHPPFNTYLQLTIITNKYTCSKTLHTFACKENKGIITFGNYDVNQKQL